MALEELTVGLVSDEVDLATARRSIESWLRDNAQLTGGPNAGGVAGAIDPDLGTVYVYPEITGYFLRWLAWLRVRGAESLPLARRAAACQRWLGSWAERTQVPPTRVYLLAETRDWRNSGIFFFDLAMVLRGLASATEVALIRVDERLVERLVALLSTLLARDGMFAACLSTSPQTPLPDRWSTPRGGFLAKAAAGILDAARVVPQITPALCRAAQGTLAESVLTAIEQPHAEAHPMFYAIEGALAPGAASVSAAKLSSLAQQIDRVLEAALPHGVPKESAAPGAPGRIDVAAQCVRATCLLRARDGRWSPDAHALTKMLHAVVCYTSPEGFLPIADHGGGPRNVWAAMFAEQALTLASLQPGDPLLMEAGRWIV